MEEKKDLLLCFMYTICISRLMICKIFFCSEFSDIPGKVVGKKTEVFSMTSSFIKLDNACLLPVPTIIKIK